MVLDWLRRLAGGAPEEPSDEVIQERIRQLELEHDLGSDQENEDDLEEEEADEEIAEQNGLVDNEGNRRGANNENLAEEALRAAQMDQEPAGQQAKWKTRTDIGAKKAKSLARRDQRRAYFEYVRNQAEERRNHERAVDEVFGDLIAEEQAERQARIEKARAQLAKERAQRAQEAADEQTARTNRRSELTQQLSQDGQAQLKSDLDRELAADLGIVVGGGQWVVVPNERIVESMVDALKQNGRVSYSEFIEALR